MPDSQYIAAEQAAQNLTGKDIGELLEELGKRIEDEQQPGGQERKLLFEADFVDTSDLQGGTLREIGRRWLRKAEAELMKFLCDKESKDREKLTSGKTIPQVAATLATSGLLLAISAPPAWAIVATMIVAQTIADTGIKAWCEVYEEQQEKRAGN